MEKEGERGEGEGGGNGKEREKGDLVPFLSQLMEGVSKGYCLPGVKGGKGGEERDRGRKGDSLLHCAVRAGCVDMVMLLVDSEAVVVGERNEEGLSALEEAVGVEGEERAVEILTLLMGRWGGEEGEGLMERGLIFFFKDVIDILLFSNFILVAITLNRPILFKKVTKHLITLTKKVFIPPNSPGIPSGFFSLPPLITLSPSHSSL